MGRFVPCLFLLAMQCRVQDCTEHSFKWVYQPYGIYMCRGLCSHSPYTFYFLQDDLSCHRGSTNYTEDAIKTSLRHSPTEERWTTIPSGCTFQSGLAVCHKEDKGSVLKPVLCDYFKDTRPSKTQHKRNTTGIEVPTISCNVNITIACQYGYLPLLKRIVSNQHEIINCRDRELNTPIMQAAQHGHTHLFNYLFNLGSELSALDDEKCDVLTCASRSGKLEIVKKLVDTGKFDINRRGCKGRTPIMWFGSNRVFYLLASKGSDLTVRDDNNNSVIHFACSRGRLEIVSYILTQEKSSLDSKGSTGWTPVMVAAAYDRLAMVKLLVKKQCDLRAVDKFRNNVLHLACNFESVNVVKYLLRCSVWKKMMNAKNTNGRTPAQVAKAMHCKAVLELLKWRH